MEIVLIKSTNTYALVMLVTLMKNVSQVNHKVLGMLFSIIKRSVDLAEMLCSLKLYKSKSADAFAFVILVTLNRKVKQT